ncbi:MULTISPECIES: alkaline phosphatase family protein [Chitinophagaceae]
MVIVDGISADFVEKIPLPNLSKIREAESYTRAYVGSIKGSHSETPTISAVSYNSVLTGVWVNKHHVWDNDIKDPNYNYPTIFRYYKSSYPNGEIAVFSSWQDNRTKLVEDRFAPTGNIAVDYSYDGLELDIVGFPHDANKAYMNRIDDSITARRSCLYSGPSSGSNMGLFGIYGRYGTPVWRQSGVLQRD